MHEVPSAATPPQELQCEPHRENRTIRTNLSRAIEGYKSTRFVRTCAGIYSQQGPTHPAKRCMSCTYHPLPASWAETARRPSFLIARASFGGGGFSSRQEQHAAAEATTASHSYMFHPIIMFLAVACVVVVVVVAGGGGCGS